MHSQKGTHVSFTFSPRTNTPQPRRQPNLPRNFSFIAVIVWTLVIALAYFAFDAILVWLLANGGQLAETGRNLGAAVGAEVDPLVQNLGINGLWEQGLGLLSMALWPLTIVVWVVGSVVLIVLPRIVGKIFGMATNLRR